MPRIPDFILDSVIYLYHTVRDAENGVRAGGSGFLVGVHSKEFPEEWVSIYAVTNKHVLENGACVVRINTKEGASAPIDLSYADWEPHAKGDDLAACYLDFPAESPFLWEGFIAIGAAIDQATIAKYNIGPGDDTYLVGRFVDHQGRQRNLPTARFGHIAMMPGEPVDLDGHPQEAFLVESRSVGGYSGSPVFVHIPPFSIRWSETPLRPFSREGVEPAGPWLLGVDCGHLPFQGDRSDRVIVDGNNREHPDGWRVRGNSGLSVVIPAWKLLELLDETEDFVKERDKHERRLREQAAKRPEVIQDVAEPRFTREQFESALSRVSGKRSKTSTPDESSRRTWD